MSLVPRNRLVSRLHLFKRLFAELAAHVLIRSPGSLAPFIFKILGKEKTLRIGHPAYFQIT